MSDISNNPVGTGVSIVDLPGIVAGLFARARRPLPGGPDKQVGLFVRYLRRKPARGLAVIYAVDKLGRRSAGHAHDPHRSVSLTLDEKALDGAHIRFREDEAQEAALEVQASGVLRAEELGLSVQAFPADDGLPELATSFDTRRGGPVYTALQNAADTQLGDTDWQLVEATAEAVRYKPASRCVVRYLLTLSKSDERGQMGQLRRQMTIYGKVYADPQQARDVQALQQRLYDEQVARLGSLAAGKDLRTPMLPRPLGLLADLGITFNEAVQPVDPQERAITGTRAMQPMLERGRGGEITAVRVPVEELRMTAIVLARLHTSSVRANEAAPRTGAKEARRARERAALIASHNAAQAEETQRLARELAGRLETLQPDTYRPAHGGFKSSQLLFHSKQVFVVDFDGFCLADSALDVGYFLAYLRPSGLWYGRPGIREWFETAAREFVTTYRQAMRDLGASEAAMDGIIERSRLYEAALIFKIATRRVNRLNSPRTKELSAMLQEIATCLAGMNLRRRDKMIGFLWRNLKGYRWMVFLAMLMAILQVVATLFAAFPMKFILDKLTLPTGKAAIAPGVAFLDPLIRVFDNIGGGVSATSPVKCPTTPNGPLSSFTNIGSLPIQCHSTTGVIVFSVVLITALGIATAILQYFELLLAAYVGVNLTARLRKKLFSHLERLSLDWHGKQKKGDLVQRVTSNISDIEKFVTDGVVNSVTGILIIVGIIIVMLILNWQFTVLSTVILPAMIVAIVGYTKTIKTANKKAAKAAGQVASVATEDIGAITVLKAFTLEEREGLRFQKYVGKNREAGLRAGGLQAQFTPVVAILAAIGTAIITGVGAYVASGKPFTLPFGLVTIAPLAVSLGTLSVFLTYLGLFYQPLRNLSKLANLMTAASTGAERIQEVLDAAPEVAESNQQYFGPTRLKGDIAFENVVFSYSADRPVLKGINLHIPAGRKVALVGLSGGGKTTLVKLITRFYEIQQGSVRVDGVDNRMYPLAILRQNVSMVLQDNVLFEGTIRENIAIGKPGATMDEVIEAAKKAYVHDTIISYPDGYETEVREQGKNFSGGQRQRLAIARAVLRDSPILILDEPTAALDVEAEAEVMHALDKLVVGRTVLMISHRLSTLGNVDEIIVLKDGRIVEQGTFKELKKSGGVFAGLLEEQNRYNLDRAAGESILRSAFSPPIQVPYNPYGMPVPRVASSPSPQQPPVQYRGNGNDRKFGTPAQVPLRNQKAQQNQGLHRARIIVEIDGKVVGERRLDKPELTIGRLSANDIPVPSQRVSRLHAKIRWENGAWVIEDAESLNGLVYQGRLVERHMLNNGDRINVAPTAVLQFTTM